MNYLCSMVSKKKNNIRLASFDDTKVVGINSGLVDYKLAWNINRKLSIDLARQDDLMFDDAVYSFFYYNAGENSSVFNLVSTRFYDKFLLDYSPRLDYLLIIRNETSRERLEAVIQSLREIEGMGHAFFLDINKGNAVKNVLEMLELHEVLLSEKSKRTNSVEYIKEDLMKKAVFLGVDGLSV